MLAASDRFVTDSVQMAEDVDGYGGGVLEAVLRKKGKFGTSRKELGNIGAAAVADVAGGEGAAATEEGADAAEEGGASRAEQGSDDDFQHVPPGATKGGRAKDAEAPSSNANGKRPMGIKGPVGAEELAGLNQMALAVGAEDAEDMLSATTAVRGLGSKLSFGHLFQSVKVADALVRHLHSPMARVRSRDSNQLATLRGLRPHPHPYHHPFEHPYHPISVPFAGAGDRWRWAGLGLLLGPFCTAAARAQSREEEQEQGVGRGRG